MRFFSFPLYPGAGRPFHGALRNFLVDKILNRMHRRRHSACYSAIFPRSAFNSVGLAI